MSQRLGAAPNQAGPLAGASAQPVLQACALSAGYGPIPVVRQLDLDIKVGPGAMIMQEKGYYVNGKGWVLALNAPFYQFGFRYTFRAKKPE